MLGKLDLLTISHCFCFAEIVNLRYLNFLIILLIEQLDIVTTYYAAHIGLRIH